MIAPPPVEEPPPKSTGGGALRFLKELPVLIALALGIALLIKAFLVQAFYIPSASMEPTLQQGDRVLVNKLSYRFGEPKRGDVIVFKDPYPDPCDEPKRSRPASCNESIPRRALDWFAEVFGLPTGDTRDFIKRIVALPGETIELRDGEVYVCSRPGCDPVDDDGTVTDGGRQIHFASTDDEGPQEDDHTDDPYQVPDESYYVLGDNRANSSDSRVFNAIDGEDIVGKAFVVVWPPTRFTGL